jgi:hypothetical protein
MEGRQGGGVSRRIAGAAALALCVSIAPLEARAPRPPATIAGWDLFAADGLLSAPRALGPAALADPPAAPAPRRFTATPEPGTVLLAALGIAGLAGRPRRRGQR